MDWSWTGDVTLRNQYLSVPCPIPWVRGISFAWLPLPALAQLVGDGFEAGRRLGGGLDVIVDLGGLLHDLAAYREAGIVYL